MLLFKKVYFVYLDLDNHKKAENQMTLQDNIEEKKDNNDLSQIKDECGICLLEGINAVIPCSNKPKHRLHKYCLASLLQWKYKICPICKTELK